MRILEFNSTTSKLSALYSIYIQVLLLIRVQVRASEGEGMGGGGVRPKRSIKYENIEIKDAFLLDTPHVKGRYHD